MNSLRRSGGSGDRGGGGSGSGGSRPSSRCGAVRWGVSGGGQMRLHHRQRESLTPQQLRKGYTSRGGGGGSSGNRSTAVQLGRGASPSSARCPYVIRTGSSLYTLATEPPQVAASAQVSASGQVAASCSCRLLSHQTLLWHHRLGHPSLPRLRGMHARLLVSGLPRSLPPLPPLPAPPCLPCVEGRQCAAPHSSSFPPTTAPLQTLHMDVWGPARINGQRHERYFLLVVDDYTWYTTDFPLRSKGEVDLPVLRLHSNRGGEFSSDLLREFSRGEGILQSFTLPDSPQQNGIAERCIGLVMEVAHTSMIHAAAPHFLWPFAVWGSCAFVRDTSAEKLSACAIPCDITLDESVPFYRLFPYRSTPPPRPPLFLAPSPPPVDPLPPQGPPPSCVSLVDPLPGSAPVEVAVGSGAASGGAEPGGAKSEGAGSGGAELGGEESGGAESASVEPGGAERESVEPGGAESKGVESGGAEPRGVASSGGLAATGAGGTGDAGAGGAGDTAGAGGTGGTADAGPIGARTRGTRDAGTGGVGGAGARDPTEPGAGGARGSCAGGARAGGARAGGTGTGGARAGGARVGGTSAGGAGAAGLALLTLELESGTLTERREPTSCPVSPVRPARRVPRARPPLPGVHAMALHPSSVPLRVLLPPPPESSLPEVPDPESDRARAPSPTVSCLLATALTDPSFESVAASALVGELLGFASACRLDYATSLVAGSQSASPPSVEGECALGTDVLEDRQEDFECLAAAIHRFASMLLVLEGDPDAPDIPTPCSYREAITGPYSSQWQEAMDAEMASWNHRQRVDYFQTFSPTLKMTTLRVLLHVAAQRDYELHSLDFSTTFLQGSLHKEIWLRRPPGFTGSFPPSTQWSLRRPVYGLRQAPREWHDTLRTTLVALGFSPSTADPSLILCTDTFLLPFYVFVYVDDLVYATADTEALTLVKAELQKRHTCTDLGELRSYLGLEITRDRASHTITLSQSHMVHEVLQRFGFQFSSPHPTPLSTSHSLSAPPSDESVEPSGLYPELVGCLMYLMTCTRPDLAYPLSLLARYVAPDRHRKVHWDAAKRVLRYLCSTSGKGLVLGGRGLAVLTGHAVSSWADDPATQRSLQG
ncbi:unnamed protein product [Closterium sp. NIES-54]